MPLILSVVLAQSLPVFAQGPGGVQASGPVDIQANEQEFAGDQVIAKGNVRVLYKDSIIHAPQATLFRDPGGNPQKAIFTGHPNLVQGKSLIDADTLTFDIANSRVIADGRAHSEVESSQEQKGDSKAEPGHSLIKPARPGGAQGQGPEKIITDADHQEYDREQDKFEAVGHVKVVHGDITVHAEKLQLVYGADKKPETAIFTGNVSAQQNQNNTAADSIVYNLATRRLQASGHVKSKVVQPRGEGAGKSAPAGSGPQAFTGGDPGAAYAASRPAPVKQTADDTITITSDSQDYSEETGRTDAEGNVRVYYQDTVGRGPKVILTRNREGKADKVYFVGRSQVSQTGRRWIADRITITVADKKVMAEGNTKAMIIPVAKPGGQAAPGPADSKLAGKPGATSISSTNATPQ